MAGYSGKTIVRKLGVKPGFRIFVDGAPAAYGDIVGELPDEVTIVSRPKAPLDIVHLFATEAVGLAGRLRKYRDAIVAGWHDLGVVAEEGERCSYRPERCRDSRYGVKAWFRRYQGLRDRRHVVRAEIRDPEGPAPQALTAHARNKSWRSRLVLVAYRDR